MSLPSEIVLPVLKWFSYVRNLSQTLFPLACCVFGFMGVLEVSTQSVFAQKNFRAEWEDEFVPEGRFLLRWGLKKGQKLKVNIDQNTLTTTKRGLFDSGEVPFHLTIVQDWLVEEVDPKARNKNDDKTATVLQTFRRLKIEFTNPTVGRISADTDQPAPESLIGKQVHDNLMKFVGAQFRMQITKVGEIKSVSEVKNEVEKSAGNDAIGKMISPQQLKNIFSQVAVFPIYTIEPNGTWTVPHEVKGAFPAKLDLKYTLKEVSAEDPSVGWINIEPELTLTKEDLPVSLTKQSGNGEIQFSFELMQVLETKLHQELELEIKPDDPADPVMQQTIKTDTSVKFKLEKQENESASNDKTSAQESAEDK